VNILVFGGTGYLGSNIVDHLQSSHSVSTLNRNFLISPKQSKFDVLIHLGSPNELDFFSNPNECIVSMVSNLYKIKSVVFEMGINHVVYGSTFRAYDEKKTTYAMAHSFIEGLSDLIIASDNVKLTIARFGNVFGGSINSMQKRCTLVPHCFIKSALNKENVSLRFNGKQKRDFISVTSVCKYFDLILKKNHKKSMSVPVYFFQ
jgi:nucleoside-diphosphate-sugar epimerase